jgi:uncharacterized cupin superfamily protein
VAIEYSIRSGTQTANFKPSPIHTTWILEGNPVARIEPLSSSADGTASTYFWDCTAGRFNWYYSFDETLYILEGSVTLKDSSGSSRLIVAGDTVFFPTGSHAEWTVEQYIRKLAFCRIPLPSYLVSGKRIGRGLKRLVRGGAKGDDAPGLL